MRANPWAQCDWTGISRSGNLRFILNVDDSDEHTYAHSSGIERRSIVKSCLLDDYPPTAQERVVKASFDQQQRRMPDASPNNETGRRIAALKNRPFVATVLVVAIAGLAIAKWSKETVESVDFLARRFGFSTATQEAGTKRAVYQLGKVVAWLSVATNRGDSVSEEFRTLESNKRSELRSWLKQVHVEVSDSAQDFRPPTPRHYESSEAAQFYRNALRARFNPDVIEWYDVGLKVESFYWIAAEKQFSRGIFDTVPGFPAIETIQGLNETARSLGVDTVRSAYVFEDSSYDRMNSTMQWLLRQLDNSFTSK